MKAAGFTIIALLAGCSKKSADEKAEPVNAPTAPLVAPVTVDAASAENPGATQLKDAQVKTSEFATQMCACKDAACAQGVSEAFTKWGTEMSAAMSAGSGRDYKPTEADAKAMSEAMQRYTECATKAMTPGGAPVEKPATGAINEAIGEQALAKFTTFTEEMCACKDKACATRVTDGITKWSAEMAKVAPDAKPTEAQTKKMQELAGRFAECTTKAMKP